ncbi:MAG TPA: hypothetical protein VJB65_01150 [Patescibacteria group bacterium]|nr:hypothetical protein [Patescibacteria group bacterium]
MVLTRRIIPFTAPLFFGAFLFALFMRQDDWKIFVMSMLVLTIVSIAFMVEWRVRSAQFWGLLFPVFSMNMGGIGLLFFLDSILYRILLSVVLILFFGVYLENVFTFRYQPQKYVLLSLPNLSSFMNTFSGFTVCTVGFALHLIDYLPIWVLTLLSFALSIAMMFQVLWSYQIPLSGHGISILLVSLLVAEGVWVLQFWPTNFFVNGMIVAVVLYCVPSLLLMKLRGILTKKLTIQYVVVSAVTVISVIATAQWK